ncbi:hypothetical protein TSUD_147470 [Trifolium subterraneum]|uniref:Uncharacterized protein n=1 Tax=Trifolium subterraneum TaxID=3900 RepID=A0A2Z6P3X0_TRISU|nr:hypothetical protein TSUD_147470 [Trifolium subterraneum]
MKLLGGISNSSSWNFNFSGASAKFGQGFGHTKKSFEVVVSLDGEIYVFMKCCCAIDCGLNLRDLQSYFADLSIFLGNDSKKMYIFVDNRPWVRDLGSRGAHIWQLMVTKSRLSPFAYSKNRRERKEGKDVCSQPSTSEPKKFLRWFTLVEAVMSPRKRVLLPVKNLRNSLQFSSELHRTLYGFIVFEVAWTDVRGINYFNELQTDTSLAIEAKIMKRWEFDNIAQAASCMSSWFSGTLSEQLLLKEHLDSASGGEIFYDASEFFSENVSVDDDDDNICNDTVNFEDTLGTTTGAYSNDDEETTDMLHTPPPSGPNKRRKLMNSFSSEVDVDSYSEAEIDNSLNCSQRSSSASDDSVETTQYSDALLSFRFNDHDLPFKFRDVIVSDLRLLTLLEAGLPSWVIFLQSYPVLCNLYRPWMCPLARLLYVLMSFVTVLIGFYDLYKNVPVLKATASRICGPFFDWIETWEMVSRVKYLGTMLFLHNFQKAVSLLAVICTRICNILGEAWQFLGSIVQLASSSEVTVSSYEVSIWRSLWNDLFSQVIFKALKSILYGLVAFFTACNRHRLSLRGRVIKKLIEQLHRSSSEDYIVRAKDHSKQIGPTIENLV